MQEATGPKLEKPGWAEVNDNKQRPRSSPWASFSPKSRLVHLMNPWRHRGAPPRLFNPVPLPFPAPIPEVQPIRVKATPLCRPPPPPPPPRTSLSKAVTIPFVFLSSGANASPLPLSPARPFLTRLSSKAKRDSCRISRRPLARRQERGQGLLTQPGLQAFPFRLRHVAGWLRDSSPDQVTPRLRQADQAPPNPGEVEMGWEKVRVSSSRSALWRRASLPISFSVIRWSLLSVPHLQFACALAFSNTSGVVEKNDST